MRFFDGGIESTFVYTAQLDEWEKCFPTRESLRGSSLFPQNKVADKVIQRLSAVIMLEALFGETGESLGGQN